MAEKEKAREAEWAERELERADRIQKEKLDRKERELALLQDNEIAQNDHALRAREQEETAKRNDILFKLFASVLQALHIAVYKLRSPRGFLSH